MINDQACKLKFRLRELILKPLSTPLSKKEGRKMPMISFPSPGRSLLILTCPVFESRAKKILTGPVFESRAKKILTRPATTPCIRKPGEENFDSPGNYARLPNTGPVKI